MLENPKYDVALSFLQKDVNTAAALAAKLQNGLDVFFYPDRQEEQGGTDGMATMRTVYSEDCHLAVILHREGWGKTKWTQVEETAIKEFCFSGEWSRLFVLMLDDTKPPVWIGPTHIAYKLDQFGIDGAVGAIKARIIDNKGTIKPMTPLRAAEIRKAEQEYQQAKLQAVSVTGEQGVRRLIAELMQELAAQCDGITTNGSMQIGHGEHKSDWSYVMTDGYVSVCVYWNWERTTTELGNLRVVEYDKKMRLPADPQIFVHANPARELGSKNYKPNLSYARELGWEGGETEEFLTSKRLAEICVIDLIKLTDRKLPRQTKVRPGARRN